MSRCGARGGPRSDVSIQPVPPARPWPWHCRWSPTSGRPAGPPALAAPADGEPGSGDGYAWGIPTQKEEDGRRRAPRRLPGRWRCTHPSRFVFLTVSQRLCLWYDCK